MVPLASARLISEPNPHSYELNEEENHTIFPDKCEHMFYARSQMPFCVFTPPIGLWASLARSYSSRSESEHRAPMWKRRREGAVDYRAIDEPKVLEVVKNEQG